MAAQHAFHLHAQPRGDLRLHRWGKALSASHLSSRYGSRVRHQYRSLERNRAPVPIATPVRKLEALFCSVPLMWTLGTPLGRRPRRTLLHDHDLRFIACTLATVCISSAAQSQATPVALPGTLITPLEQIDNGTVLVQNGRILASGANVTLPHPARHPFGRMLAPLAESAY